MKMFVTIMDRFVWLLILTVFSTLALEKSAGVQISKDSTHYLAGNVEHIVPEYVETEEVPVQTKRSEVLDNIFKIPIATLSAVSDLVQSIIGYQKSNTEVRVVARKQHRKHGGKTAPKEEATSTEIPKEPPVIENTA